MSKYIWCWGYDGTIMYVYEVYKPRFRSFHKLRCVKSWYTSEFDDVQLVAEQFIERIEQKDHGYIKTNKEKVDANP